MTDLGVGSRVVALERNGLTAYDHALACERNTYDNITSYLNGLPSSRPPAVSSNGDVFYFYQTGFLKISRKQEKIFMHSIPPEVRGELEKRTGSKAVPTPREPVGARLDMRYRF